MKDIKLKPITWPYFRRLPAPPKFNQFAQLSVIEELRRIEKSIKTLKATYIKSSGEAETLEFGDYVNERPPSIDDGYVPIWDGFSEETVKRLWADNAWRTKNKNAIEPWLEGYHACSSSFIHPDIMPAKVFRNPDYRVTELSFSIFNRKVVVPALVINCNTSHIVAGFPRDVCSREKEVDWSCMHGYKACHTLDALEQAIRMQNTRQCAKDSYWYGKDWSEVFLLYGVKDIRGLELTFPLDLDDFSNIVGDIAYINRCKTELGVEKPITLTYILDVKGKKVYEISQEIFDSIVRQYNKGEVWHGLAYHPPGAEEVVEALNREVLRNRFVNNGQDIPATELDEASVNISASSFLSNVEIFLNRIECQRTFL